MSMLTAIPNKCKYSGHRKKKPDKFEVRPRKHQTPNNNPNHKKTLQKFEAPKWALPEASIDVNRPHGGNLALVLV